MQRTGFGHISRKWLLIVATLIAVPVSSQASGQKKCGAPSKFIEEMKVLEDQLTDDPRSEFDWKRWERLQACEVARRARLADRQYKHYQHDWRRAPAFLLRGMKLTAMVERASGANTAHGEDGLPIEFESEKTLRQVAFGWSDKKILEDLLVLVKGPKTLHRWKTADCCDRARPKPWSLGNLLLERISVDATVAYGRTVDFRSGTTDLDDLSNETTWNFKVQYELPIDKLLGFDYDL